MKAVQQEVRRRTLSSKEDREAVLRLQSGLAATAARKPRWRFYNLYPALGRRAWLEEALDAVLDNTGAETPGVDGMRGSALRTPTTRQLFVQELQRELKRQRYRPAPVLRVYIPKPSGNKRPLGIPTIRDRVVQMALKMLLEPIFEADFVPNSNGFRPERSTLECVLPTYRYGDQIRQYNWVIEADIKGCFDNINQRILLKTVGRRIADKKILKLIKRFLRARVVERGVRTSIARKGTPQGGVISPFLSNVYLHRFDRFWWKNWGELTRVQRRQQTRQQQANCVLFRYADDFVLMAKGTETQTEQVKDTITQYFWEKLRLELNPEKTRIVPLSKGFSFLGFRIQKVRARHGEYIRIRPTQKNVMRLVDKLRRMLGKHANSDDPMMKLLSLNRVLRGWGNYYKAVNAQQQFRTIDYIAKEQYFQWMARKTETTKEQQRAKGARYKREDLEVTLFELSSLKSERTSMDHKRVWKYRHIGNPYLSDTVLNKIIEEEQPIVNEREIHPLAKEYNKIYLENRMKRFRVDGWKCLLCGSRVNLIAHHVERVPKGDFDPVIVHRVENLRTVCTACHKKVEKQPSLLQ
jgi:group II intron reverse transcriptase/maturase